MPSHSRPSPRAAIHTWLSYSASKAIDRQRTSPSHSRRHHGADKQLLHLDQDQLKKSNGSRTLREAVNPPSPPDKDKSRHNDETLPQRLSLSAPFRPFGRESNDMDADEYMLKSTRKRKRSFSVSSNLEPATFPICRDVENDDRGKIKSFVPSGVIAEKDNTFSELSDGSYESSSLVSDVPRPSYERKGRHKTREYYYELKQAKVTKKPREKKKEHNPKEKKCKRRNKSGSALMHDFAAENVAFDRLTLRSTSTVGLINKGRSSSPAKRRGLPDLAFSEVTFLKSKKEKSDDPAKPAVKRSRLSKDRAADSGAEISRYFTSRKAPSQKFAADNKFAEAAEKSYLESEYRSHDDWIRNSRISVTPLAFVDLPGKPFLGFGSSGADMTSSAWLPQNIDARTDSLRAMASSTRSVSFISWSASGAPSHNSPKVAGNDMPLAQTDIQHDNQISKQGNIAEKNCGDAEDQINHNNQEIDPSKIKPFEHNEYQANDKVTVNCVEERDLGSRLMSEQDKFEQLEPSLSFDAAIETFIEKCCQTTQPVPDSNHSFTAHSVRQSEKSMNIEREIPPDLDQVKNVLPASIHECVSTCSALRCNVIKLTPIVPTRAFELQADHIQEQHQLAWAGNGKKIHPSNNIYPHQVELEGHTLGRNRAFQQRYTHTTYEDAGGFLFSVNHANRTRYELEGPDDHENGNYYEIGGNTMGSEGNHTSFDEENIESAMRDIEDLSSHRGVNCGTVPDADPAHNELLQHGIRAENSPALEDNYLYLPDHALETLVWPDKDGLGNDGLEIETQEYDSSWNSLTQDQGGAGNSADDRQTALLQLDDEETFPGFWKPHKLY